MVIAFNPVRRTRIKICGITRPEDAICAARAGADAIGLVFHPPVRRNISLDTAYSIMAVLPPFVTPVGLFVDQPAQAIIQTARELGLRHVQLHGAETPETVRALRPLVVIKAIRVIPDAFADELARWRSAITSLELTHLRGLVLETAGTRQAGGTGVENDWDAIAQSRLAGHLNDLPPIIAAGGLTPQNVADVIALFHPHAVDVSSGVENDGGLKAPERISAFVRCVAEADRRVASS